MVASPIAVKTFGEFVRDLREERKLNRSEFAVRAGVGHPSRVREVEGDTDKGLEPVDPSLSRVQQIAKGFGLTLTALIAQWEGVDLVWTKAGRKAIASTEGDEAHDDGVIERGGAMADDLGQSLLHSLGLVPAEKRKDFVEHCIDVAVDMRRDRHLMATGTDPKA